MRVIQRTLNYPRNWPHGHQPGEKPREKGIDVALALDYVTLGVGAEYDVGILMSTDTDLKPALEFIRASVPSARAEVAAWSALSGHSRRLAISGQKLWCHWLDDEDYASCADSIDYTQ